jgi:23S rRNA (uracil1939-C5)-methyltransferase
MVNTHPAFTNEKIDTIIVDPPRSGLHPNVIERILKLNIKTILYVSCNPVSQAANLQALCHDGAYTITAIQPIDMLPNTYHVENIVKLERKT